MGCRLTCSLRSTNASWGAAGRRRRHRPRFWQPRHPQRPVCGRQAGGGSTKPAQPSVLDVTRLAQPATGGRRAVPAPFRGGPRPRYPGDKHHRGQRGAGPSDVDPGAAGRSRPRPRPELPDSHYAPVLAGAEVRRVPYSVDADFFSRMEEAFLVSWPRPRVILTSFPTTPPPPASSWASSSVSLASPESTRSSHP